MKNNQSTKIILQVAQDAIKAQQRRIAPEANMAKMLGSDVPSHIKALEKYNQMQEAIDLLSLIMDHDRPFRSFLERVTGGQSSWLDS